MEAVPAIDRLSKDCILVSIPQKSVIMQEFFTHQVFKLPYGTKTIVFAPTLSPKIHLYSHEEAEAQPSFIFSPKSLPRESWDNSLVLFIQLTDYCNLSCVYCYEYGMSGNRISTTMTSTILDRIFQLVTEKLRKDQYDKAKIVLFGGEPASKWKTLTECVSKAQEFESKEGIKTSLSMSTNGCFNPKKIPYLIRNLDRISFSIDGFPHVHNKQRPRLNGGESYPLLERNVKTLLESGYSNVEFRITITPSTQDEMLSISEFLTEEFPGVLQNYEPVMVCSRQNDQVNIQKFIKNYMEIYWHCRKTGTVCTTSLFDLKRQSTFCGITSRFTVFPDGEVCGCHRVNRDNKLDPVYKKFRYGTVFDTWDELNRNQQKATRGFNIRKKDKDCFSCFARYFCRGGCYTIKIVSGLDPAEDKSPWCDHIKEGYKKLLWDIVHSNETD